MDMSGFLAENTAPGAAVAVDVKLVRKGAGPAIAGYPTDHYVVTANGKRCGEEFLSNKAMDDLKATAVASERFWQFGEESASGMGGARSDPCDLAGSQLGRSYRSSGIPLRVLGADGSLDMEVTRIVKNAAPPPGGFALPSGYAVIDMQQQMQDAMRQMQQMVPPQGMSEPDAEALRRALEQMQEQMQKRMDR